MIRVLVAVAQIVGSAGALASLIAVWRTSRRRAGTWTAVAAFASLAMVSSCAKVLLGRPWELLIAAVWTVIVAVSFYGRRLAADTNRWIALAREYTAAPDDGV